MNEYTEPTEQGYYLDREGDLWRLVAGQWVFPESDEFAGEHERYAPFTRLMTEGEWEAKRTQPDGPPLRWRNDDGPWRTHPKYSQGSVAVDAEWETKRARPELPRYAPLSYGSWSVLHKQGWDAAREYLAERSKP